MQYFACLIYKKETPEAVLPASLCAKIMVFRRITRIIEVVLNERAVLLQKIPCKTCVFPQKYVYLLNKLNLINMNRISLSVMLLVGIAFFIATASVDQDRMN